MNLSFCLACFEKQRKIDQLEEENRRLKQQLRYRQEKEKQGFFGAATSSAKRPLKANSPSGGAPNRDTRDRDARRLRKPRPLVCSTCR